VLTVGLLLLVPGRTPPGGLGAKCCSDNPGGGTEDTDGPKQRGGSEIDQPTRRERRRQANARRSKAGNDVLELGISDGESSLEQRHGGLHEVSKRVDGDGEVIRRSRLPFCRHALSYQKKNLRYLNEDGETRPTLKGPESVHRPDRLPHVGVTGQGHSGRDNLIME